MKIWMALLGIVLIAPVVAGAEGFYLGAQGGVTLAHDICDDAGGWSCDDEGVAAGVLIGYEMNDFVSLEGGYRYFDEYELKGWDPLLGNVRLKFETESWELVALVKIPTGSMVSPYLRGGIVVSDVDLKITSSNFGSGKVSDTETDPILGVGVSVRPSAQHEFRLSYDFVPDLGVDVSGKDAETNVSQMMLGYYFHF